MKFILKSIKSSVRVAALIVFVLCFYSFLLGNGVMRGEFSNDALAWYFLAKGIFCSLTLVLLSRLLGAILNKQN